jgi:hypothetical protein
MLENNRCILVYGLSGEELKAIKGGQYKVIEVTPEMCEMQIKDILTGLELATFNSNPVKEKVILYNNFSENEMREIIKLTRTIVTGGVLAMVTPTSINWKMNYLIEHLIEEREWYLKNRKE